MNAHTALEIADKLDELASIMRNHNVPTLPKLHEYGKKATDMLRSKHAEIERLSAINSALTAKSNALVDENAWLIEKIGQLTDEKFRRFNNEECWIYQRTGENHLGTLACPVVISPEALLSMQAEISILTAEREEHAAEIDRLKRERHLIYDLLARIHRDGGQYTAEHGVEKSCDDAEAQVVTWLETISSVDSLIEQARIAEREACAKVCDELEALLPGTKTGNTLQWAAESIRARGKS